MIITGKARKYQQLVEDVGGLVGALGILATLLVIGIEILL
jgi:hypothetical protein